MPPPEIAERLNKPRVIGLEDRAPQVAEGQGLCAQPPGPEAEEREEERSGHQVLPHKGAGEASCEEAEDTQERAH